MSSSLFAKQAVEIQKYNGPIDISPDRREKDKILEIIKQSTDLRGIYMLGGEPLVNEFHDEILDYLIKSGKSKRIVLHYNTNLQIDIEKYLKLWSHFLLIDLGVSIDGCFETYEYIRWPGTWNKLYRNLQRAVEYKNSQERDLLNITIATTVQNLNAHNIPRLIEVIRDLDKSLSFYFIPVSGGNYLELTPKHILEESLAKLLTLEDKDGRIQELTNYYKEAILKSDSVKDLDHFFNTQAKFDSLRKQDLFTTLPHFKEYAKLNAVGDMASVTIITTVYGPDIPQLYLQAHSLLNNWKGSRNWIIIADDEYSYSYAKENIVSIMRDWEVEVVLTSAKSKWGWHRQQIGKIDQASKVKTDYSIILDTKNFLMKPSKLENFMKDGTWFMSIPSVDAFYQRFMPLSEKTLGLKNVTGMIPVSITPWIWKTSIVQDLVSLIPEYTSWDIVPGTEFFFYWLVAQRNVKWQTMGWVTGLWAGQHFVKEAQDRLDIYKEREQLYWWTHHMGHTGETAKNLTIEILKHHNSIKDETVYEKWKELAKYIENKFPGNFSIYTNDS